MHMKKKESCGLGRHCSKPGDKCNEEIGFCESSKFKPFCDNGRQLRGTYLHPISSRYDARPSFGPTNTIHYDGDKVGTCGPEPTTPIPCGPNANQQCPWARGSDLCCHVDPLQKGAGYCDTCESPKAVQGTGNIYIFSPDTFSWSMTTN